jgi:hypothetical protein
MWFCSHVINCGAASVKRPGSLPRVWATGVWESAGGTPANVNRDGAAMRRSRRQDWEPISRPRKAGLT